MIQLSPLSLNYLILIYTVLAIQIDIWAHFRDDVGICSDISQFMPTKQSNAQHLVEYEKQLVTTLLRASKFGECHAKAHGFQRLWYEYELRKSSH